MDKKIEDLEKLVTNISYLTGQHYGDKHWKGIVKAGTIDLWLWFKNQLDKELQSAHLKWNKEMREKIGGDEDIELDLDDPNGKEIQTLNIYRNQFRHQLLKQKVKDLDND